MTAEPLWRRNPGQTPRAQIQDFTNHRTSPGMVVYGDLWCWSVNDLDSTRD